MGLKLLVHHPRFAPRSPPRKFLSSFSGEYNLQAAIDFAALPILARQGVAGFAPKL